MRVNKILTLGRRVLLMEENIAIHNPLSVKMCLLSGCYRFLFFRERTDGHIRDGFMIMLRFRSMFN